MDKSIVVSTIWFSNIRKNMKLGGWQRLWVLWSVIYLVPPIFFLLEDSSTKKKMEWLWVDNTIEIAKKQLELLEAAPTSTSTVPAQHQQDLGSEQLRDALEQLQDARCWCAVLCLCCTHLRAASELCMFPE